PVRVHGPADDRRVTRVQIRHARRRRGVHLEALLAEDLGDGAADAFGAAHLRTPGHEDPHHGVTVARRSGSGRGTTGVSWATSRSRMTDSTTIHARNAATSMRSTMP